MFTSIDDNTEIQKITNFWNSVAHDYGKHTLTTSHHDDEISYILNKIVKSKVNIDTLASVGCADGSRDPNIILRFLVDHGLKLPLNLVINDISPVMISQCKKRINSFSIPSIISKAEPIELIDRSWLDSNIWKPDSVSEIFIGVYNIDFIKEALELYHQESDTVGKEYSLTLTILSSNSKLEFSDKQWRFNINDYMKVIPDIIASIEDRKKLGDLYGISIQTEKNFVSHYFYKDQLKYLLESRNANIKVTATELGARYLMFDIEFNKTKTVNTILTMINNVLGNIAFDNQVTAIDNLLYHL